MDSISDAFILGPPDLPRTLRVLLSIVFADPSSPAFLLPLYLTRDHTKKSSITMNAESLTIHSIPVVLPHSLSTTELVVLGIVQTCRGRLLRRQIGVTICLDVDFCEIDRVDQTSR